MHLIFSVDVVAEEEDQVCDGQTDDGDSGHDALPAAAEVVLLDEVDRIRLPYLVAQFVQRVPGPVKRKDLICQCLIIHIQIDI